MPKNLIHVYPIAESHMHSFSGGADCYCEPEIENHGTDTIGMPVRLFVHQILLARFNGFQMSLADVIAGKNRQPPRKQRRRT